MADGIRRPSVCDATGRRRLRGTRTGSRPRLRCTMRTPSRGRRGPPCSRSSARSTPRSGWRPRTSTCSGRTSTSSCPCATRAVPDVRRRSISHAPKARRATEWSTSKKIQSLKNAFQAMEVSPHILRARAAPRVVRSSVPAASVSLRANSSTRRAPLMPPARRRRLTDAPTNVHAAGILMYLKDTLELSPARSRNSSCSSSASNRSASDERRRPRSRSQSGPESRQGDHAWTVKHSASDLVARGSKLCDRGTASTVGRRSASTGRAATRRHRCPLPVVAPAVPRRPTSDGPSESRRAGDAVPNALPHAPRRWAWRVRRRAASTSQQDAGRRRAPRAGVASPAPRLSRASAAVCEADG